MKNVWSRTKKVIVFILLFELVTFLTTEVASRFLYVDKDYENLLGASAASFIVSYCCYAFIKDRFKYFSVPITILLYGALFFLLMSA